MEPLGTSLNKLALIIVICLIVLDVEKYCAKKIGYRKAEAYAVRQFGDKRPPLTMEERREWYDYMGVKTNHNITLSQLRKYIAHAKTASLENKVLESR